MRTSIVVRILFGLVLCLLFALQAYAHPGSGIVVNKQGEIFFTDTGRGVWKIDRQGKLTYLPASRFHWMALDEAGSFAGSRKSFGEEYRRKIQYRLLSRAPIFRAQSVGTGISTTPTHAPLRHESSGELRMGVNQSLLPAKCSRT